ncbi:MAG TPA: hypothetical protein VM512_12800 [Burkholderiaceae bacterium]|nr:hypothetical protein [Burkholderiaceae bacterium]
MNANTPMPGPVATLGWLRAEHAALQTAMRAVANAGEEDRRDRVDRLVSTLVVHIALIEEIVVPTLQSNPEHREDDQSRLHLTILETISAVRNSKYTLPGDLVDLLLRKSADLLAYEIVTLFSNLATSRVDLEAVGRLLARRQQELVAAGLAR